MALKALLCSGNDKLPQYRSVLRAINTLNSPKNYIRLLGGLLFIHLTHRRRAQGLMWGTRGPFLPVAAMVGYGCVGWCWPLEAYIRSTYLGIVKIVYGSIFLFLRRSVTAKIGFSADPDLHEKLLCRIGSISFQNHVESNLYVFVSVHFFLLSVQN